MKVEKSRKARIVQELDTELAANEFIRKNIMEVRVGLW